MSKIAKKSRLRLRVDVNTVNGSKVVAVSVRVYVAIDLQNIAGDVSTVPLEEAIDIIAINRGAAVASMALRECL